MNRYSDHADMESGDLSPKALESIPWTKYKIVVSTEADRDEIMLAMKHIHDSDVDSDIIVVNQLIHEYLEGPNIIVNQELYEQLNILR